MAHLLAKGKCILYFDRAVHPPSTIPRRRLSVNEINVGEGGGGRQAEQLVEINCRQIFRHGVVEGELPEVVRGLHGAAPGEIELNKIRRQYHRPSRSNNAPYVHP